jgi:hypothetical protein
MKLADFVVPEAIIADLRAGTKEEAFGQAPWPALNVQFFPFRGVTPNTPARWRTLRPPRHVRHNFAQYLGLFC